LAGFGQEPAVADYRQNLENDAVKNYMQEVRYEPGDDSELELYRKNMSYRGDWPKPVTMVMPQTMAESVVIVCCDDETLQDSLTFHVATDKRIIELYNLIPQRTYRYEMKDGETVLQHGKISTEGQVRMLNIQGAAYNIRDLGGWKTIDNKRIKYGKIIRGSELNGNHIATEEGINLLRELGVEAEVDLRAFYNPGNNTSVFGFTNTSQTPYGEVPSFYYASDSGQLPKHLEQSNWQYRWRTEFNFIVRNLRVGRTIYQHCVFGKDRTGFLSFLLEGLLGVPYDGLAKDYELSYFSNTEASKKDSLDKAFNYICQLEGETVRDKFYNYFRNKIKATQEDIDFFCDYMLEDVKDDDSGITTAIERRPSAVSEDGYYDLMGRRVSNLRRGSVYIRKEKNGSTRKVYCH